MIETIYRPLNWLFAGCFGLLNNYALVIVVFTLLIKVILFPISLWTHRNSLKMVSLMPELNRLKIKYYGDKDTIAGETQKLYKREHYHPLASTIPMFIQLALLIGVIGAVREILDGTESMLSAYPAQTGGITLLMPVTVGCSALLLGLAQNHLTFLQREQTKAGQWMSNGLSIAISLALGAFVHIGVGGLQDCQQPSVYPPAADPELSDASGKVCRLRRPAEKQAGAVRNRIIVCWRI